MIEHNRWTNPETNTTLVTYKFTAGDKVTCLSETVELRTKGKYPESRIKVQDKDNSVKTIKLTPAQATALTKIPSLKGKILTTHSYDTEMKKGCVGINVANGDGQATAPKAGMSAVDKVVQFCKANATELVTKYGVIDVNSKFIEWATSDAVAQEVGGRLSISQATIIYKSVMESAEDVA